jgi:hypothetical protein
VVKPTSVYKFSHTNKLGLKQTFNQDDTDVQQPWQVHQVQEQMLAMKTHITTPWTHVDTQVANKHKLPNYGRG